MHVKLPTALIAAVLIAALAGPVTVLAHGGAKGIVKERMELMKSIGKAMKSISKMARGKATLDGPKVVMAAGAIARHGEKIPTLFPKGTHHGVTEASPKIWQDPEGFRNSTDQLVSAARSLASAARANDAAAVKTAYRSLGKTCGGCHKQFRIKKKKRKH